MMMRMVIVVVGVDAAADAAVKVQRTIPQKFLMRALKMNETIPFPKMVRKKIDDHAVVKV